MWKEGIYLNTTTPLLPEPWTYPVFDVYIIIFVLPVFIFVIWSIILNLYFSFHQLFLKILFIYLFIYFWLCWVFVSVRGLSLVAASRGHSSSRPFHQLLIILSLWFLTLENEGAPALFSTFHVPLCEINMDCTPGPVVAAKSPWLIHPLTKSLNKSNIITPGPVKRGCSQNQGSMDLLSLCFYPPI